MTGFEAAKSLRASVVICTRNRARQLAQALQSLEAISEDAHEIVVVDNAPPDESARHLAQGAFTRARYVREPREGLDFARNRGIAETSGEIVAFLDDDAVAERGWLKPLTAAFERDPRLALCFGRVEALSTQSPGARLFEANGGFDRGAAPIDLPREARRLLGVIPLPLAASIVAVGSGCSMAIRRGALARIGGFDNALDLGRTLPGGGDLDVVWRFLEAGFHVRYEPASRAAHEHRAEEAAATHQIIEHNRALIATLTKMVIRSRGAMRCGACLFLLWRLLKPGLRIVARLVGRDPLPVSSLLQMWLGCWRGIFAYPAARKHALAREKAAVYSEQDKKRSLSKPPLDA